MAIDATRLRRAIRAALKSATPERPEGRLTALLNTL
jgi:hypothetical protein